MENININQVSTPGIFAGEKTFVRRLLKTILTLGVLLPLIVFTFTRGGAQPGKAVAAMGFGLVVLWIVVCGSLMFRFRDKVKNVLSGIRHKTFAFIIFMIALVMVEEMVTTLMTNLAPVFGSKIGEAYITASTNYWDVIFFHSLVAFIPAIIGWGLLLRKYYFTPGETFILWGLSGILGEAVFLGDVGQLVNFGFWMSVYGLMIWLPTYCFVDPSLPRPRWYLKVFSVPMLFIAAVPYFLLAGLLGKIFPNSYFAELGRHPKVDFQTCLIKDGCER